MALFGKKNANYISAKETKRISKENRKITNEIEKKRNRKNIPESEYITTMKNPENVVEFDNVHTYFFTDIGTVKAVDGVSFEIPQGKTVGVVGESGCGKSVTSLSLMQLVQRPQGQTVEGEIRFNTGGKVYNIVNTPTSEMQKLRGNELSMIFQEPMTALNPVFRIGEQVDEITKLHNPDMSKEQVKARTIEMLELVGIANSEGVYKMYPHELSGGMRQRVCIAIGLACNPRLIIADEPVAAIDASMKMNIVNLFKELRDKYKISFIYITHDLSTAYYVSDYIATLYRGCLIEYGPAKQIMDNPAHPYTELLMSSVPRVGDKWEKEIVMPDMEGKEYAVEYCKFAPRCPYATDECRQKRPDAKDMGNGRMVLCCHPLCQQTKEA